MVIGERGTSDASVVIFFHFHSLRSSDMERVDRPFQDVPPAPPLNGLVSIFNNICSKWQLFCFLLLNKANYNFKLYFRNLFHRPVVVTKPWRFSLQVEKSAELIGYFVSPTVWCKMILDGVRLSQSVGSLIVLAAVIRGSQQAAMKSHLNDIVGVITEPSLCRVADVSDTLLCRCSHRSQ